MSFAVGLSDFEQFIRPILGHFPMGNMNLLVPTLESCYLDWFPEQPASVGTNDIIL